MRVPRSAQETFPHNGAAERADAAQSGLVAVGAAAPYFFEGRKGRYASKLELLAKSAKNKKLGLWGACPRTQYDPYRAVDTRR